MTSHELRYCRFLLRCVQDLHIETAAMSTILDTPALREGTTGGNWRSTSAEMTDDSVYRSAIEANYAPYFERLKCALNNEQVLASLLHPD
jgi:hypothetical protein